MTYVLCKYRTNKGFLCNPWCYRDNKTCTLDKCPNPVDREEEE